MQNVFAIVAPVFGLIALGFLLARTNIMSKAAGDGLTEFVFTVAVPALLFRMMITAEPAAGAAPFALLTAYYGALAIIWLLAALATRALLKRSQRDGASIAMGSAFGNIVMLGIPLALDRFGTEAATPIAIIVSISSPLLWFSGTLHVELATRRGGTAIAPLLRDLIVSLLRNPIILALVAGLAWRALGIGLHPIPNKMITLLGDAAIPGALVALGLSLTGFQIRGQMATMVVICTLSLIVAPAIAWLVAFHLFSLPPLWAGVAVLFAACPPGANAFLFASQYDAAKNSVSGAVALGTALSAVTVSLVLAILN